MVNAHRHRAPRHNNMLPYYVTGIVRAEPRRNRERSIGAGVANSIAASGLRMAHKHCSPLDGRVEPDPVSRKTCAALLHLIAAALTQSSLIASLRNTPPFLEKRRSICPGYISSNSR